MAVNPRKADLRSWRSAFARELQDRGIEAVATYQPAHGASKVYPDRWRVAAQRDDRERSERPVERRSEKALQTRLRALEAWGRIHDALAASPSLSDRQLATNVAQWLRESRDVDETRRLLGRGRSTVERTDRVPSR
jgi:hypothetical protein